MPENPNRVDLARRVVPFPQQGRPGGDPAGGTFRTTGSGDGCDPREPDLQKTGALYQPHLGTEGAIRPAPGAFQQETSGGHLRECARGPEQTGTQRRITAGTAA